MNTNTNNNLSARARAAAHVYDAECALHAARQTAVDGWITAASNKLHQAILDLNAAEAIETYGWVA
jgi:hypothetical protein